MKTGKAAGRDDVPVELYQSSATTKVELIRIIRLTYDSEIIPTELVRGVFIMLCISATTGQFFSDAMHINCFQQ